MCWPKFYNEKLGAGYSCCVGCIEATLPKVQAPAALPPAQAATALPPAPPAEEMAAMLRELAEEVAALKRQMADMRTAAAQPKACSCRPGRGWAEDWWAPPAAGMRDP